MDEVWRFTQDPAIHERWDLRFTEIRYLPKADEAEPQRFLYATRIGFGLRIEGCGESTGEKDLPGGARSSALKFWSGDWKSLIVSGGGYWKYVPGEGGTRFLTWYDYETRFGWAGTWMDRVCFRPLIGWATAWSFDALRLWLERGQAPETSIRFAAIHTLARGMVAFTWLWHGLVPKLLVPSVDELRMLQAAGLPPAMLPWIGIGEIGIAILALALFRWRGFFLWNVAAMVAALLAVAIQSPGDLFGAFNPVTLNGCVIALSIAGYVSVPCAPFAGRCKRSPSRGAE